MNKQRRKILHSVLDELTTLKDIPNKEEVDKKLRTCLARVEICCEDEEMALDNLPETFAWSAMNEMMTDNVSDLSDAMGDLEILIESCNDMGIFDYNKIKGEIAGIVNTLKNVIHR